jgi:hypothetical protein
MLRRRSVGARLVVGLLHADPSADAHAWLVSETGVIVVGGEVVEGFTPVTQFG